MKSSTTSLRLRFQELIERAEAEILRSPGAYRRKLALLAALGYAYLLGILILTIGLIVVCVFAATKSTVFTVLLLKHNLGIFLGALTYVLIKALWVRLDPPSGHGLNRQDFPILYHQIDELGKSLKAPKIHEILLTHEFNAGIQQTPRLGVFGWYRNTLILGLPLLLGLSKPQCIAVIAHEFGHLTGNHNRFNGWIYRVRTSWWRIMEAFNQAGGAAAIIFGRFFDWYAPYFNAYSFALARANEYQADAVSARVTSNSVVASALLQTNLLSTLLETEYWDKIDQQAAFSSSVPKSTYTELKHFLEHNPFSRKQRHATLKALIKNKTGHSDTHPALKDRINALTERIPAPHLPEVSAAQLLLGDQLDPLLQIFDAQWAQDNAQRWTERHEYLRTSKAELTVLEKKQKQTVLENDERWKLAAWTEEFRPYSDPLPLYQSFWQDNQDDPAVNYAIGRLMLERGDADGLMYLIRSMRDHHIVIPACEIAFNFHSKQGNNAAAEEFRLKAERQMDIYHEADAERTLVGKQDQFENPGLERGKIESMVQQLHNIPKLKSAWLCRKILHFFPEDPLFVVVIKTDLFASEESITQLVLDRLDLPGSILVLKLNSENKALAKKAIANAEQII